MAATNSFCLHEEELSCPICFEDFNLCEKNRHPKLLLCLHTFCLACVETLRKYDGSLQCSICRTSHQVYRVGDLMDNYLIFEHLKKKQEWEDEKLAVQLREEYEVSMRLLQEQEERDAQLARAEDEKNRLEEERIRKEEAERERIRLEEMEKLRLEESRRRAQEEMNRREVERQRREEEEAERQRREEEQAQHQRREEEVQIEDEPHIQIGDISLEDNPEETESSSESLDVTSDDESTDSENEDTEEEDEECFQDLEVVQNDGEEGDGEERTSRASFADLDDYETLSSDTSDEEHCSTEIVSSDDEDEMGTALSTTAPIPSRNRFASCEHTPSTSPEPDLLSEEFSGVAQPHTPSKPHQDALDKLLPAVKCAERSDGSIIILNSSTDEATIENGTPSPRNPHKLILAVSTDESEEDHANYSSEEENLRVRAPEAVQRKPLRREHRGVSLTGRQDHDDNCKLQ